MCYKSKGNHSYFDSTEAESLISGNSVLTKALEKVYHQKLRDSDSSSLSPLRCQPVIGNLLFIYSISSQIASLVYVLGRLLFLNSSPPFALSLGVALGETVS